MALTALAASAGLSLATGLAAAQPGAPADANGADAAPAERAAPIRGTREDLARAYLRLERALAEAPLADADIRRVNELFDRASMRLYGAGYLRALELINEAWIVATLRDPGRALEVSTGGAALALAAAASVRAVADPIVALASDDSITLGLRTLYDWSDGGSLRVDERGADAPAEMWFKVIVERPGAVEPLLEQRVRVLADRVEPVMLRLALPPGGVEAGVASIVLEPIPPVDGVRVKIGAVRFAARSLDALREETMQRLDALERAAGGAEADALAVARRILRARASLLTDAPSANESSEFLQNPAQLARDVQRELTAIEREEDPYSGQVGDRWQVILARGAAYPARLFAPQEAARGAALPLVIAFHGAGGDENLFMDGYAAGRLKKLAAERGFVLVTPRTSPFASSPVFLDGLLKTVEAHYAVDRNRVYVMGHSLGAGVTAGLARLAHDVIAACVCFAGGGAFEANGGSAPTLVYAAELDPIIPAWRTIEGAERARLGGLPIEPQLVRDRGHTLFIGDVLDEAVDWLFARTLDDRNADGGADAGRDATAP